jgi:two-component system, OmpR family, aerobic respiration control sensor histidine kinase ArcB
MEKSRGKEKVVEIAHTILGTEIQLGSVIGKNLLPKKRGALAKSKKGDSSSEFNFPESMVLLVEDHRISAKVAKNILSDLHCKVDVAMDGKTAIELIQSHPYDLIFVDIGLPDMTGYALTRRIRTDESRKGTHVPIIGLTAYSDTESQKKCLDVAMNAVVVKPLQKKQAEEILNAFIPGRKKFSQNMMESDVETEPEEKIVDFAYAKSLLNGDEKGVSEMLIMLVDSLPHEVEKLNAAYQEENWGDVQALVHKLNGGASYCGTLRLKSACSRLDSYILSGATTLIPELYTKVLDEITALQKFMGHQKVAN